MWKRISTWIQRALSEPGGSLSSRRIAFVIVVAYVLGLATAALYVQRILTPEMVDLLKATLYATAGALALGKFAEGPEAQP